MANVLIIKGYTSADIKAELTKHPKYKIGIKLHAIYQLSKGVSSRKLSALYGFSFKQILTWAHRFEAEGVDDLKDKKRNGRNPKLSEEQLLSLKKIILSKSPADFGFNTATWTGVLIQIFISNHYQVVYKKAQIYNILKKIGLSYQKCKGKYAEPDISKQQEFKNTLKKTS